MPNLDDRSLPKYRNQKFLVVSALSDERSDFILEMWSVRVYYLKNSNTPEACFETLSDHWSSVQILMFAHILW